MSMIPAEHDNPNGLHQRYIVTKANGEPVDPMAAYFVLRLDQFGDDWHHIQACRAAALAYADYVRREGDAKHLDRVADDLRTLIKNVEIAEFIMLCRSRCRRKGNDAGD